MAINQFESILLFLQDNVKNRHSYPDGSNPAGNPTDGTACPEISVILFIRD